MTRDNRKEEGIYEGLGDYISGVLLESGKYILEQTWESEVNSYLQGIRGCSSLVIQK